MVMTAAGAVSVVAFASFCVLVAVKQAEKEVTTALVTCRARAAGGVLLALWKTMMTTRWTTTKGSYFVQIWVMT